MKINEILSEGGWASTKTQNTVITPQFVADVRIVLQGFEKGLNAHLASKNIPPVGIGHPCGSGTYYERDLKVNPTKEYGDIDVHFYIPRMEGLNNNQTTQLFADNVKEFCNGNPNYETENGKNVIVQTGNDFVQVDLVTIYYDNKEWSTALAPEWNVKGVLCASLYSALAEAMNISISSHGVQAKTVDGQLVKFGTTKNTKLITITTDKDKWAVDIVKYFGGKKASPLLKQYPGVKDEVRVADIINSIKGICQSLDRPELIQTIKEIYLGKIHKTASSSKFDKAETPAAIEKAHHTKEMLMTKSAEIAALFDR